jgi:MFS family permease
MFPDSLMSAPRRIFAGFALYAFSLGNIFPRLGDVQHAMGVAEGALGLGLIGAPVGTLVSLTFAPPFLERIGFRRALLAGIPLLALFYAVAVMAPTPLWLFLLLLPVGLVIGCIEIVLNLEADRVEHAVGYRIMNRSHAFWSIGFFAAGLFGAAMAGLGLTPQAHLALVVPLAGLGVWLFLGGFRPAAHRPTRAAAEPARLAAPTRPILILVSVTLSAMLLEGASMDWSAIYMRDAFAAGPFLSGLAVAVVAASMAVTRFFADSFVERHSPAGVARVLLAILLAGCLVVVLSPDAILSLVGFGLIGVGLSVIFPLAMSAAAQRTDRPAAVNVAALAQFSFMIFLLAPPLLGFVAEHWGIRASFAIGLPLILLSFVTAGALGGGMRRVEA